MASTLLIFFFFTLASIITDTHSQPTPSVYYNTCSPYTCSNLSLPYPFSPTPTCHPPLIQPLCPSNTSLLLTSPRSTDTFRVLSLDLSDPTTASFSVASDSLFTCGAQISNPNYANDAAIFSLPFNYTPGTHFNCTSPIANASIQGLQSASCLGCPGQDPGNVCYYAPGFVSAEDCEVYHIFTRGQEFNASGIRDLRGFLRMGFQLRYVKPLDCRGCETSGGRCGAQPRNNGSFVCFCPNSVHPLNCSDGMVVDISDWVNGAGGGRSGPSKAVVAAISASASVLLLVVIGTLVVILIRRKKHTIHFNKETISSISPTRYSYSKLKRVTGNFATKLGEGGFGSVYKGSIHRGGVEVPVAVKVLKISKQTEKQFMNEVQTIGSVHHQNLVGMLGYCVERDTHALVYEFMENGSLDQYIYSKGAEKGGAEDASQTDRKKLSSRQIYSIALETARGLLYLHQGCRSRILHCDIKPPNVLLDSSFSAKVADFGLAKMIDKDQSHVSLTGAQGTPGYAAPEMWMKSLGPVTDKSDVYSYGMLILEMVGRRKNFDPTVADSSEAYFPEWLYNKVERDEFPLIMNRGHDNDSLEVVEDVKGNAEDEEMAIRRMSLVGLWCIQYIPSNRPSMDKIVQMLEGHVEIGIPPAPFPESTGIPLIPFPQNRTRTSEGTSEESLG